MKLYTAVVKEIQEKKTFSAYDITTSLRKKVNDFTIEVDDVVKKSDGIGDYSDIIHSEVNDVIKEIYDNKILSLERDLGFKGYYIYRLVNNQRTAVVAVPMPGVGGFGLPNKSQTLNTNKVSPMSVTLSLPSSSIETRVKSYIENKKKKNDVVTLSRIQRALKKKGVFIDQISNVCSKLGYKVIPKTPKYRSEVQ